MIKIDIEPEEVTAILSAILNAQGKGLAMVDGEVDEDSLELVCEDMVIAHVEKQGDSFDVVEIACYSPVHGTHRKYAIVAENLNMVTRASKVQAVCPMCSSKGWLPADGEEARTAASFAISLGVFRGVELPKTDELKGLQSIAMDRAFAQVLDHPLIKKVQQYQKGEKIASPGKY